MKVNVRNDMSAWDEEPTVRSWADDDEETTSAPLVLDKITSFVVEKPPIVEDEITGYEDYDDDFIDDERAYETPLLSHNDRVKYEAHVLSNPPFVDVPSDQICNIDLTPLVRNNYPNVELMKKIADCFSDKVEVDEDNNAMAVVLRQKLFDPLVDTKPGQMRYVVQINGVPFMLRREDYSDWNDDVIHQYMILALMRKLYSRVPMLPYPFAIFSSNYNCQYTGDPFIHKDKFFNFLLTSYTPFNRDDKIAGGDQSSNEPGKRQMSFHVAVAPPRSKGSYVKPLLNPQEAWNMVKLMIDFLEYAGTFYRFSHGDAHYHNWYLRDLGEVKKITIPWETGPKHFFTRYLPVLYDFGRASFIYDENRYGLQSSYYAVPPPIDYILQHDTIQLLYGLIKDFDYTRVNYQRGTKRGYLLDLYFNGALQHFYKLDPIKYSTFRKFDIVAGSENRGTSFAEMARLFTGKPEVVEWIFSRIDKEFGYYTHPPGTPLRASTEKVKILGKRCPIMPDFPSNYKLPVKSDFEDARARSEIVNYLREEDDDNPSEALNYLINFMTLSMKLNQYDPKEGLVIDRLMKQFAIQGIKPEKFNSEDRKIYDDFVKFRYRKDLEHKQARLETSSAQLSLAGPAEYISPPVQVEPERGQHSPRGRGASRASDDGFRPVFGRRR